MTRFWRAALRLSEDYTLYVCDDVRTRLLALLRI
jgi:hypothetical protein